MRIISGKYRGKLLKAGKDSRIRPTSDKVRGAIFNVLKHGVGCELEGIAVLDVCCGTGAFACEALSRGAAHAVLIDQNSESLQLARKNIESIGASALLIKADATRLARSDRAFGLAFIDPPYHKGLIPKILASLNAGGWLESGAILILEYEKEESFPLPPFTRLLDRKLYGGTAIAFLEVTA